MITESDLTNHRLIDSVFIASIGTGSGSMVLAGITVHKQVIGYRSNSGKSTGWAVRFDWIGSEARNDIPKRFHREQTIGATIRIETGSIRVVTNLVAA